MTVTPIRRTTPKPADREFQASMARNLARIVAGYDLSRVLAGKQAPGPKFIAALVSAFPGMDMDDLFEVVDNAA